MQKGIVSLVQKIKHVFHIKTWIIEYVLVGIILIAVALISHKGWIEWIGVLAVFLNFGYVQIADRMEEKEAQKFHINKKADIECYWKLKYYFYGKEILWFAYFLLLGAYSALAGVILFLLYPWWRKVYRKHHPLK